jgi:hypothetical protein
LLVELVTRRVLEVLSLSRLALVATMPSVVLQHLKVVQLVGGTALVVPL